MSAEVPVPQPEASEVIVGLHDLCAGMPPVNPEPGAVIASGEFTDEFRLLQTHIRQTLRHKTELQNVEEVTQAALVKIWENQHKFTPGSVLKWSGMVATNLAIDTHRKTSRTIATEPESSVFLSLPAPDNTESEAVEAGAAERIDKLLLSAGVSKTFRGVVRLYALGYGQTETAAILGISRGSVGSKLHRGLAQLREHFGINLTQENTSSEDVFSAHDEKILV